MQVAIFQLVSINFAIYFFCYLYYLILRGNFEKEIHIL